MRTTEEQVAVPSGVVTFLFTDIEGSTRRWEADADAMRAALKAHDTVLREAIEGHAGWLFKHTGDGVCAAFTSPRSAVDAAVTAQRALELPVRMGISTGEAELRGSRWALGFGVTCSTPVAPTQGLWWGSTASCEAVRPAHLHKPLVTKSANAVLET